MVDLIAAEADLTLAELRDRIAADTGVQMSWSLVRLWVGRLELRLKKVAPRRRTRHGSQPPEVPGVP